MMGGCEQLCQAEESPVVLKETDSGEHGITSDGPDWFVGRSFSEDAETEINKIESPNDL